MLQSILGVLKIDILRAKYKNIKSTLVYVLITFLISIIILIITFMICWTMLLLLTPNYYKNVSNP